MKNKKSIPVLIGTRGSGKTKAHNEFVDKTTAEIFLTASSTKNILEWTRCLRLYGEYKFSDKKIGKAVDELREAMWHDGTDASKKNFQKKHSSLAKLIS